MVVRKKGFIKFLVISSFLTNSSVSFADENPLIDFINGVNEVKNMVDSINNNSSNSNQSNKQLSIDFLKNKINKKVLFDSLRKINENDIYKDFSFPYFLIDDNGNLITDPSIYLSDLHTKDEKRLLGIPSYRRISKQEIAYAVLVNDYNFSGSIDSLYQDNSPFLNLMQVLYQSSKKYKDERFLYEDTLGQKYNKKRVDILNDFYSKQKTEISKDSSISNMMSDYIKFVSEFDNEDLIKEAKYQKQLDDLLEPYIKSSKLKLPKSILQSTISSYVQNTITGLYGHYFISIYSGMIGDKKVEVGKNGNVIIRQTFKDEVSLKVNNVVYNFSPYNGTLLFDRLIFNNIEQPRGSLASVITQSFKKAHD